MTELKNQRNELIRSEFKERYNINTWNKIKVHWVYSELGKKYFLSVDSIRKIVKS